MTDVTVTVSPLRRRMIDDMSLRNLSPATQRSYLHAVTKFSRYFGRSPDRLGLEDVRAFQVYLVSQGISWGSLNQIVCALRFFYGVTLDRAEIPERIVYARMPRKLPTILSADEVVRFLEAVPSLKARAALTTAYAAGLRASEAASLKVADIDSDRMVIQIHHGKGAKASGLGHFDECFELAEIRPNGISIRRRYISQFSFASFMKRNSIFRVHLRNSNSYLSKIEIIIFLFCVMFCILIHYAFL